METSRPQSQETRRTADRLHEAVENASTQADSAEQRTRQMAHDAADRVREGAHQARVKSEEMAGSVKQYIRENPMMALGVAFAAGTIVASLGRRH